MKDISHFRGKREDERKASAWHADIVGPTTPGIGVDSVGNLQTGTQAIIFANDLDRDISTCMLRKGTASPETKENVNSLKSRYNDTVLKPKELLHDRGPEMTGAKKHVEEQGIADKPRVRHGATIEGVVGRTSQCVRMSRLRAGWPVALWPLVMSVFLFNLAWFAAGGTEYETTNRGQWLPVHVGARVLYLPTNNSDVRMKRIVT